MYNSARLRVFDYYHTDIDEDARIPTHIQDKRLSAVRHTDYKYDVPAFSSLEEWEARKTEIKTQILTAAGLSPMPVRCPLNARIFDKTEHDGFTVEKVAFESYAGFFVTGNLYRPAPTEKKCPAILNAHGHWEGGRLERSEFSDIPARCANLAKLGFIAFAYDMIGYNDSMQVPHTFGGAFNELWGMGGFGVQLWNSIRCIDFLESLQDVDSSKISCTGASGGASQAFFLAAVDDRIKAVAAVNMVSAHFQGGCCCENAALLRVGTNNVEIAATIAPRPLLLTASDGDWTVNMPTVEYQAIHSIYALYKKEYNVEYFYQSAPHNYNKKVREAVYNWLCRMFSCDDKIIAEQPVELEAKKLRVFADGEIKPLNLFSQLKEARRRQLAALWEDNETAELLKPAMTSIFGKSAENPAVLFRREEVNDGYITELIILGSESGGEQIPIVSIKKRGAVHGKTLAVFHGQGKAAAIKAVATGGALDRLLDSGSTVVSADLFLTGEYVRPGCAAGRDYSDSMYFTTFNRTDDAYKVSDICLVLRHLQAHGGLDAVSGLESAGLYTLAGLACGEFANLNVFVDLKTLSANDDDWYAENFFVPGFCGIGGETSCLNICRSNGVKLCHSMEEAFNL